METSLLIAGLKKGKSLSSQLSKEIREKIKSKNTYESILTTLEHELVNREYSINHHLSLALIKKLGELKGDTRAYLFAKDFYTNCYLIDSPSSELESNIFSVMMKVAHQNNDFAFVKKAFGAMKSANKFLDSISYNQMINFAGKNGDLVFAKEVFNTAKEAKVALDGIAHDVLIGLAGQTKDLAFVNEAFAAAKEARVDLHVISYNIMIAVAGQTRNLAFAKEVFAEAKEMREVNCITYSTMISVAWKNKDFTFAKEAFAEVKKMGVALDARGYITVIHLAGESDDLAFSKEVFVAAKTAGVAFNGDGYGTVISVAGKAEDLVFIKEVFTTAKEVGVVLGIVSYNTMMYVAGKNRDLAFAKEVFNAAKEAKVALDNISYTIMIDAAGQNGDVSLAKRLFDTFFERFGERFIHEKNDRKEIELHFLNYWTAYFLLLRSDLEKLLRINTRIIFGKGIHTKKKSLIKYKMIHDTRRATIDALGEVFPKQKYIFNKLAGNTDIGHFDFENGSLIFPEELKLERKKSMPEKLVQECIPQEEVACGGKQSTCRKKRSKRKTLNDLVNSVCMLKQSEDGWSSDQINFLKGKLKKYFMNIHGIEPDTIMPSILSPRDVTKCCNLVNDSSYSWIISFFWELPKKVVIDEVELNFLANRIQSRNPRNKNRLAAFS